MLRILHNWSISRRLGTVLHLDFVYRLLPPSINENTSDCSTCQDQQWYNYSSSNNPGIRTFFSTSIADCYDWISSLTLTLVCLIVLCFFCRIWITCAVVSYVLSYLYWGTKILVKAKTSKYRCRTLGTKNTNKRVSLVEKLSKSTICLNYYTSAVCYSVVGGEFYECNTVDVVCKLYLCNECTRLEHKILTRNGPSYRVQS